VVTGALVEAPVLDHEAEVDAAPAEATAGTRRGSGGRLAPTARARADPRGAGADPLALPGGRCGAQGAVGPRSQDPATEGRWSRGVAGSHQTGPGIVTAAWPGSSGAVRLSPDPRSAARVTASGRL
jgi:hypothetical protein